MHFKCSKPELAFILHLKIVVVSDFHKSIFLCTAFYATYSIILKKNYVTSVMKIVSFQKSFPQGSFNFKR